MSLDKHLEVFMKKFISTILILCLCIVISLSLISCNSTKKIDKMKETLLETDNMTVVMKLIDVPNIGTIKMIMKLDGNKQYISGIMGESDVYYEIKDGCQYEYYQDYYGAWRITNNGAVEEDNNILKEEMFEDDFDKLFDSSNFEAVKGERNVFKQKSHVIFDSFEDVYIIYDKDGYTINAVTIIEGVEIDCSIIFSNYGTTKVELPL